MCLKIALEMSTWSQHTCWNRADSPAELTRSVIKVLNCIQNATWNRADSAAELTRSVMNTLS